jgi:hypothetical protein
MSSEYLLREYISPDHPHLSVCGNCTGTGCDFIRRVNLSEKNRRLNDSAKIEEIRSLQTGFGLVCPNILYGDYTIERIVKKAT